MRPMVGLSLLMLGFALMTPSCARLNFFKPRRQCVGVRTAHRRARAGD